MTPTTNTDETANQTKVQPQGIRSIIRRRPAR
jgi:hypothetical protein